MPNECTNEVVIYESKEKLEKLIAFVASDERDFDFNKIIPCPEGCGNEWRSENWGTKWNAVDSCANHYNNDTVIGTGFYFITAWSPSLLVTKKLSELFPEFTFVHEFSEENLDFEGYATFKNGEQIDHHTGPSHIRELMDEEEEEEE